MATSNLSSSIMSSSHPSISYPKPVEVPSSVRHSSQRHKAQKSSLSGTMSWLTRSSSSTSVFATQRQPYAASKPVRISEPKVSDIFTRPSQASGSHNLGSGATVVRTPQEALAGSGMIHNPEMGDRRHMHSFQAEVEEMGYIHPPSPPSSPPLPPLPTSKSSPSLPLREVPSSPPKTRYRPVESPTPPSVSQSTKSNSVPKSERVTQPPFDAILMSPLPSIPLDPFKTVVALDTCTEVHRTTLSTLMSRPSNLSEYFISLLDSAASSHSEACSMYSQSSDIQENLNSFNSIFHNRLAAAGVLSQSAAPIHIFLDRPSAPYAHILAYLRTPKSPNQPPTLPRAAQLASGASPSRIEALLELRDEANFLQLEELYRLCIEELRSHRQKHLPAPTAVRPPLLAVHARGTSSGSNASGHTLDGIEEQLEDDDTLLQRFPTPPNSSSTPSSRAGSGYENTPATFSNHSLAEVKKDGHSTPKSRPAPTDWI